MNQDDNVAGMTAPVPIDASTIDWFRESLLLWYSEHGREFPWRNTDEPYALMVAEKLLQQTSARPSVVAAYVRILDRYPSPYALATADPEELETVLRPLGFHYRSREIINLAQVLVDRHGGVIPADLPSLLALPGIGDYIARAILSFALGQDVPVVDTNVARFLHRIYGLDGRTSSNPARNKPLISLAGSLVPPRHSKEWNLAILDLCALICRPSSPLCIECPVLRFCNFGTKVVGHVED